MDKIKVAKELVKLAKNLIAVNPELEREKRLNGGNWVEYDDRDMREDDYSYDFQQDLLENGYYDPSFPQDGSDDPAIADEEGKYVKFTGTINWVKVQGEVERATFRLNKFHGSEGFIYFQKGIWKNGTFYSGTWKNGTWKNGTFENSGWLNGTWEDGKFKYSSWDNGTWKNGYFLGSIWEDGIWKNGTFKEDCREGQWLNGTWENGTWKSGHWYDGTWKDGTWEYGEDKDLNEHGKGDSPDKWEK